jgi:imidazole glycerol phosphate synthase glutamine amidotransferase subunit
VITLVDLSRPTPHALEGALDHLGFAHVRAPHPDGAAGAGPLVIQGAGSFEEACVALKTSGWWFELPQWVASGRPLLGIGLGLHLLAEGSEECPKGAGLGLVPGIVRSLGPGVRLPHRGWARVESHRDHPQIPDPRGAWMFFDHAHALEPSAHTLQVARWGRPFAALELCGQCVGIQPHPCKSGSYGLAFLERILAFLGERPETRPPEALN